MLNIFELPPSSPLKCVIFRFLPFGVKKNWGPLIYVGLIHPTWAISLGKDPTKWTSRYLFFGYLRWPPCVSNVWTRNSKKKRWFGYKDPIKKPTWMLESCCISKKKTMSQLWASHDPNLFVRMNCKSRGQKGLYISFFTPGTHLFFGHFCRPHNTISNNHRGPPFRYVSSCGKKSAQAEIPYQNTNSVLPPPFWNYASKIGTVAALLFKVSLIIFFWHP